METLSVVAKSLFGANLFEYSLEQAEQLTRPVLKVEIVVFNWLKSQNLISTYNNNNTVFVSKEKLFIDKSIKPERLKRRR